jgi:hypothetical protein
MDWSRAKTILIAVFLILNIGLFVSIAVTRLGDSSTADAVESTIRILQQKNVVLRCEIPTGNSKAYSLDYESNVLDRSKIAQKLLGDGYFKAEKAEGGERQIKGDKTLLFRNNDTFIYTSPGGDGGLEGISDRKSVESYLRSFIGDMGIGMSSFVLDLFEEKEDGSVRVLFTEEYKGFLVFDNYVDVLLDKNGIISLDCRYKKVKGFLNDSTAVMPAHQVLLKNFVDSGSIVITAIDKGFKGYEIDGETKESSEGPAWRVMVESIGPLYFRASDGRKIE